MFSLTKVPDVVVKRDKASDESSETTDSRPVGRYFAAYHMAWLAAHPYVDSVWLDAKLRDGFDIHHVDGNRQNNLTDNLLLIYGPDHTRLHKIERRIQKLEATNLVESCTLHSMVH